MATRKAKVSRAFLKEDPLKKTEVGDEVIAGIGGHPSVFMSPTPPVTDLTTANNDLRTKTVTALNGDKIAIEEREAAEKEWDKKFGKSATYVDTLADGDTLIIEQSGFKSTKTETTRKEKPGQALIKVLKGDYTTHGKIDIEVDTLAGADFYIAFASQQQVGLRLKNSQALVASESEVAMGISTTRKISIEELQSRQEYEVVVVGYNTAGIGAPSQVAKVVVP